MTHIDVHAARAETPGCEHVLHFNNAGSALPTTRTLDAHLEYLRLEATIGGYEAMAQTAADADRFYSSAAQLIGCRPDEIAFQSGASEAWWRAFLAVGLEPGDRVLAGTAEFQTAALGLMQAKERGIQVELIPDGADGQVDLDAFEQQLKKPTALVCMTQIAMSNGLVHPAAEVGRLAHDAGALYLLDACQAVGQIPVDVDDLRCDFLTATGRKWLRGPRGSGLLYVRASTLPRLVDPVFIDGRAAEWDSTDHYYLRDGAVRFELAEMNPAGRIGLGVAIEQALELGIAAIEDTVAALAAQLRSGMAEVDGVTLTDRGTRQCGIVSFHTHGMTPQEVADALHTRAINTSSPPARNSRYLFEAIGVDSVVRASPHYYNTEDEVVRFVAAVDEILG